MILAELLLQTGDVEADRHTVHVAGAGAGHGVDVGVRVNPEHHRVLPPTRLILMCLQTYPNLSKSLESRQFSSKQPHTS